MDNDKPQKGARRLVRIWDDKTANYVFVLYRYLQDIPRIPHLGEKAEYSWWEIASGDQAWADRIAEHYKLEIFYDDPEGITKDD